MNIEQENRLFKFATNGEFESVLQLRNDVQSARDSMHDFDMKLHRQSSLLREAREAIKEAVEELRYDPSNGPMVAAQLQQAFDRLKGEAKP